MAPRGPKSSRLAVALVEDGIPCEYPRFDFYPPESAEKITETSPEDTRGVSFRAGGSVGGR